MKSKGMFGNPPRARRAGLRWGEAVPRYWLGGSAVATHVLNAINLLFPLGERFFIRSVARYSSWAENETQAASIRGFLRQESQHAIAHESSHAVLEQQGYSLRSFLSRYERSLRWFDRWLPNTIKLAATAAGEHFAATLAKQAFCTPLLEQAEPRMKELLLWHAAEEIEHKTVVYDLLRQVDPAYATRVTGLVIAATALGTFWFGAVIALIRQDELPVSRLLREAFELRRQYRLERDVFGRAMFAYLELGFHPTQIDDAQYAEQYLADASVEFLQE